jgi:phosphopentomutase/2,3-bisphosphoglycerate-independent phosphoglycerate mutase family metalloenzyme
VHTRFRLRRWAPLTLVAFYISLASSVSSPAESRTLQEERLGGHLEVTYEPPRPEDRAVVLVVVDGVRWQELFGGADRQLAGSRSYDVSKLTSAAKLVPNLQRLIETRGVALGAPRVGPPMMASGPNFISLPGYMEIFSGRTHTSCGDNRCPAPPSRTLVDDVREYAASSAEDVAVISSWAPIGRAAATMPGQVAMSAGRARIENPTAFEGDSTLEAMMARGARARAWPGDADYRPDAYTAPIALRYLETRRPRFLFIGLGDTDEYAHRNDYRGYVGALRDFDATMGDLAATLDRMGDRGRHTTVLVTTDHGRSRDFRDHGGEWPESANVWLVAFGGEVGVRGIAPASAPRRLADVAPTVRVLLGLPQDPAADAGNAIEEIF